VFKVDHLEVLHGLVVDDKDVNDLDLVSEYADKWYSP
jgi:hypothetical protein